MSPPSDVSGAVNGDMDSPYRAKVKEERFSSFFILTVPIHTNIFNIMIIK